MFNFLKSTLQAGIQVNSVAKAVNAMNVLSKEIVEMLVLKVDNEEAIQNTAFLAYICRKGIRVRLESNDIPLNSKVIIPSISSQRVVLGDALSEATLKLSDIAEKLEMSDLVQEIVDGGPAFYAVEKSVPNEIKRLL